MDLRESKQDREASTHCSTHLCIPWSTRACALMGIEPTTLAHWDNAPAKAYN